MSDLPLCPLCPPDRARPLHDGGYVCARCTDGLALDLDRLAGTAGEAMTTVAKQSRTGGGGRRTSPDQPLPVNLGAGARYDAAVNELVTRARMVAEERGKELPYVSTGRCGHETCGQRRRGMVAGPRCADLPPEHPITVLAAWLTVQLEWLRHHPDGEVAIRDLRSACRDLERVIDRSPDRWYAGPCAVDGCEEELYPTSGSKKIRCGACGAEHDPDERRAWLLREAEDQLAIANWCASALTMLGIRTSASTVRTWAERARIVAHGTDPQGRALYRLGDVRDLAIEVAHQHAAKEARDMAKGRQASLTKDHPPETLRVQADAVCPQPA